MKISTDGKTYPDHLAVLNGLFGKSLGQHSMAVSPLRDAVAWFPHVSEDDRESPNGYINRISNDGKEILEFWPNKKVGERELAGKLCDRVVFAHFLGRPREYEFLGVFKFDSAEKDHIRFVRTKTEINTDDYWPID